MVSTLKDEVDKKWLAISYGCILLGIYFLFIAYASFSPLISESLSMEMPTTTTVNATSSMVGNFASGITGFSMGSSLLVVGILTFILMLIMYFLGHGAMGAAL